MFEKAARRKYRFESTKGLLTVEDLWDLPLTDSQSTTLDDIALELNQQLENTSTKSFVKTVRADDDWLKVKFEIVKHIIEVRLLEIKAEKQYQQKRRRDQQLLQLISEKKNDELRGKSIEELEAMINA